MTTTPEVRPSQPATTVAPAQPRRTTVMAAYCRALTRYSSCLRATAMTLRNDEELADEELRQRDLTGADRLRAIEEARERAGAGHDDSSRVRRTYGLPAALDPVRDPGAAVDAGAAGTALEPGAVALARNLERLRDAEVAFGRWQAQADRRSTRAVVAVTVVAGLLAASVMVAAGGIRPLDTGAVTTLVLATMSVVAAGVGVAIARRWPLVCTGPAMARVPDVAGVMRAAGRLTVPSAGGLVVVNLLASVA